MPLSGSFFLFINSSNITFILSVLILATCVIFWLCQWTISSEERRRRLKFAEKFPGPTPLPFLGNSLDFMRGQEVISKKIMEREAKYGPRYKLWLGSEMYIVLSDAEEIEQVLYNNNALAKPRIFSKFADIFGWALFTLPVEEMKLHRKKLVPAFNLNTLNQFAPIIQSNSERKLYGFMDERVGKGEFDPWDCVGLLALDNICRTMMDLERDPKALKELHILGRRGGFVGLVRMLSPLLHVKFIDDVVYGKEVKYLYSTMSGYLVQNANEKLEAAKLRGGIESLDKSDIKPTSKYFWNAYGIAVHKNNIQALYDELLNIVVAGTETVSITVSFCLLALAMYPDIQEKVQKEIEGILGTGTEEKEAKMLQHEDLKKFTYMEQVVKETLRRFTIVPYIYRTTATDMQIGGIEYPANTNIIISIMSLHLNPKYYSNPLEFDPDHFSPEACKSRPKCAYIPFSAGARNCIGMLFAWLEIKLILITLLRRYNFRTSIKKLDDVKLVSGFLQTSGKGYPISVHLKNPPKV